MRKRNHRIVLGLATVLTVAAGCAGQRSSEPIAVGVLAPRTGPNKARGEMGWQGVLLAKNEGAGNRLIHGRTVRLQQGDTGAGSEHIRAVASRLVEVGRVRALLAGLDARHAEGLASVAAEGHVPLIVPVALPGESNDFVFHTTVAPPERGQALARFALEQNARRALVLSASAKKPDSPIRAAFRDGFQQAFQAGGGTVSAHMYGNNAELNKLIASDQAADVLVLAGPAADLAALPADDTKKKHLMLWTSAEGERLDLPASLPAGMIYLATSFWLDEAAAPVKEFTARYRDQFKQEPDIAAALAYDDARLLFEGLRRAERLEPKEVRESLASLANFASLTGPVSIRHGWARRTVFVLRLDHGKAALAKAYPPAP